MAAFFLSVLGIGRKEGKDEDVLCRIQSEVDFSLLVFKTKSERGHIWSLFSDVDCEGLKALRLLT